MIQSFKQFCKSELAGWTTFDLAWLAIATTVILALSLWWQEPPVSLIASLTGVWCVILTGKGKRSSFLVGTVNVLAYAYVSYGAKYYGEVMLNLLYYFPMDFIGFAMWKKHMNDQTGEVEKQKLKGKKALLTYSLTAIAIVIYGFILKAMGGELPFVDSMSTIVSVTAMLLSIWRLTEQWVLWIVVDAVTILMWAINFAQGKENISVLFMWIIYLVNAIIMFIRWNKEAKDHAV